MGGNTPAAALLCAASLTITGLGAVNLWAHARGGQGRAGLGMVLLAVAPTLITVPFIPWYAEDVPGTLRAVTAQVADKDLDPTHEEVRRDTDLLPVPVVAGSGVGIGLVAVPTERIVHVPAHYSVLLEWSGGQVWLPVEGRLYRKLEVGSTIQLQLRERRQVTLLGSDEATMAAGPITGRAGAP
jgi:hypothetical protein